jgi:hypothetical protein
MTHAPPRPLALHTDEMQAPRNLTVQVQLSERQFEHSNAKTPLPGS